MSNFEWYTDEDGDWSEMAPSLHQQPEPRRWLLWLSGVLVVCLAIYMGYRRLDRRVEEVSSLVTAEILSSYELRQQAIASHDKELFNSVLSGGSLPWMQSQQSLFEQNLLLDRWPLALPLAPADAQLLTITPTANLQAAELIVAQKYVSQRPDGVQESVTLHRTDVYRLGRQRWLYAAPTPEFWGDWLTANGRYLTLTYPQRDQSLAQQLLSDFDHYLDAYCALPGASCRADLHLWVRFSTHPQSLLELSQLAPLWPTGSSVDLPTPSLIGLPIDEAGYQALLRGYSQPLIAAAIYETSEGNCCERGLFQQALLDKQLSQLGLKAWPLADEQYSTIFQASVAGIDQLHRYWQEPAMQTLAGNVWPHVYGVIDFVLWREADVNVAAMQRALPTAASYTDWLYTFTRPTISNDNFQRDWLRFAAAHLPEEPVALPDQDILLLCRSSNQRTSQTTLFRYDPHTDTVTPELVRRNFLFMAPLPQDDGVFLHERQVNQNQTELILWRNDQEIPAYGQPLSVGLFHIEAQDDTLTLYGYDFAEGTSQLDRLSLSSCAANHCPRQRLNGTPYWSPNGRYALLVTDHDQLQLTDAQGNTLHTIGTGTAPFWLNETQYGYARVNGTLSQATAQLMTATVTANQPQQLLPLAELASTLPAPLRLSHLTLRAIASAPNDPDMLFIATHVRTRQSDIRTLLFSYQHQTGDLQIIYTSPYTLGFYKPLLFSQDGRWLAATTFAHTSTLSDLFLYHLPSGDSQILGSNYLFSALEYDWSADSRWLLRLENSFLHLIDPATGQQKVFIHELSGCGYAAWVNQ